MARAVASRPTTGRSWTGSPRHTVVGVDYPGSGRTPTASAPLELEALADQLVAAADAEGLDTFAVCGYSLGGPVAIRAAVRRPARVTSLVLSATFARVDTVPSWPPRSGRSSTNPDSTSCSAGTWPSWP
ncbi:alpha/beta fold hydrolase [Streptomyces lasalocidi]